MEELLIEEKAKRYDSMFERLKKMYENNKTNVADRLIYERYFPELKESEDEKMIQYFKDLAPFDKADELHEKYGFSHKDAIAWLEKQDGHAKFINGIQVGDKVTRNEDGVLVNLSQLNRVAKKVEKQGEQKYTVSHFTSEQASVLDEHIDKFLEKKSVWSEKYIADVFEKVGLAKIAREQSNDNLTNALQSALIELGKFMPQQKPAWSEEDEKQARQIERIVHDDGCTQKLQKQIADWFKSLKERCNWKPSDEQMKILNEVLNFAANHESPHWNDYIFGTLNNLIRQLKKLREE